MEITSLGGAEVPMYRHNKQKLVTGTHTTEFMYVCTASSKYHKNSDSLSIATILSGIPPSTHLDSCFPLTKTAKCRATKVPSCENVGLRETFPTNPSGSWVYGVLVTLHHT